MPPARETRWTLYLDESGDFDEPLDPVAVGGLLLRDDLVATSSRSLAAGLKKALPWLPWPLHAGLINQPAYMALVTDAWLRSPDAATAPAGMPIELMRASADATEHFRRVAPTEYASLAAAYEGRRKLNFGSLTGLGNRLAQARPQTAAALRNAGRAAWAQVRDVPRSLAGGGKEVTWLLAASETELGDAAASADARYFAGLEALLHRLVALLTRLGGRHVVGVKALARDVWEPQISKARPLRPQDLDPVIRLVSDAHAVVRLRAEGVEKFDAGTGVEFVLADFIANQARRALRQPGSPLRHVEELLELGCPVRSGEPPRSHVAATGRALVFLRTGTAGWTTTSRRWAVEQAEEWAARG